MPWDVQDDKQAGQSILIGEKITDPIPPFDPDHNVLNWKLIKSDQTFDTTGRAGQYFVFWVVVWMEDGGQLVPEIQGHGLTALPGTLNTPYDVPLEMAKSADGTSNVSYSNNVGYYHYRFPVIASSGSGLGAPAPADPALVTMKNVSSSKRCVKPGGIDIITAVLRSEGGELNHAKVFFYDGDPDRGGQLIGAEKAWLSPRTTTQVKIAYHAPRNGIHRIWAVINEGKSSQVKRHTAPIFVGQSAAGLTAATDGDLAPKEGEDAAGSGGQ
jgi:hypothetical protein